MYNRRFLRLSGWLLAWLFVTISPASAADPLSSVLDNPLNSEESTQCSISSFKTNHKAPDILAQQGGGSSPIWSKHVDRIIHNLAGDDLKGYFGFLPHVEIATAHQPNAFAIWPNNLVLSSGLLDLVDSSDELAFILAHELGHLALGHGKDTHALNSPDSLNGGVLQLSAIEREVEADRYAIGLMDRAGFDSKAAQHMLTKLGSYGSDLGLPLKRVYPSLAIRLEKVELALKRKE